MRFIAVPRVFRLAAPACLLLCGAPSGRSQMVTGSRMEDFAKTFGISAQGWSVQQIGCSLGANALWPGDEATFTFHVQPGQPYKGPVKIDVIQYGTKGKPGDWWKPIVFKIADTSSSTVEVDLPAGGGSFEVKPKIGNLFGGYALVLELGDRGRAFGCSCVRVPASEPGREWQPTYALDLGWPHEMSPAVFNVFKRLGVKGARTEGGYNTLRDAHVDWAMENDVTLMLTVGCGGTPGKEQPLGRGRPWLRANGEVIEGVKEDLAWLPSFDPEFKRYLKDVLIQHGWPKGPVNAVELWNEPWEGVSISGWGADGRRTRQGRGETGGQGQHRRMRHPLERTAGSETAPRCRPDREVQLPRQQRRRRVRVGRRPQRVQGQLPELSQRLVHPLGERTGIRF